MFNFYGTQLHTFPNGLTLEVADISKFFSIGSKFKNNPQHYLTYEITDTDRPDNIAKRIYNNDSLWWLILLYNGITDPSKWPVHQDRIDELAESMNPEGSINDVAHYVNEDGIIIDPMAIKMLRKARTIQGVIDDHDLTPVTYLELAEQINNERRQIRVLDPDVIGDLEREIQKQFK